MITRRTFLLAAAGATALIAIPVAVWGVKNSHIDAGPTSGDIEKLDLSEAQWKERLTFEEFNVLRKEATEKPFSSPLNDEKLKGIFACAGCDLSLFKSETKFKSGTGWPSFYNVIDGHVETKVDLVLLVPRTEYHCARCGGHQGHIFKDGPHPTGLRYCNNGVALKFIPVELA